MEFGDESREKAEFNMAVSYLNRINLLFSACDQASISLDVYAWFHSLLAAYRELSTWMKKDERIKFNNKIKEINPQITKIYQRMERTGKVEISHDFYMQLHDMEIELRDVAKSSGLLMRIQDDAMNALR